HKIIPQASQQSALTYYTVLDKDKNIIGEALNVFDDNNLGNLIYSTLIFKNDMLVGLYIKDAPLKDTSIPALAPTAEFQKQFIGKTINEITALAQSVNSGSDFTLQMAKDLIQKGYNDYTKINYTITKKYGSYKNG
ncbi:MAG: hypothetical protein ACRCV0_02615, partial [Brevinema sp.]